jgi:hypothetical protein
MLGWLLHAPRGPFYSPKAARSHWIPTWKANLAFCRVVHRTVRCTTGQLLFMFGTRFLSIRRAVDRWSSGSVGAPDSPVCPTDRWRDHVSREDCADDHWCWRPLAHQTVRWIIADAAVETRERRVHRGPAWCTGHCPVHLTRVDVWLHTAKSFPIYFFSSLLYF